MNRPLLPWLLGAATLGLFASGPVALADDETPPSQPMNPDNPARPANPPAAAHEIKFGDVARFSASLDKSAGSMTFRLVDPNVKITSAPVVRLQTDSGPRTINLTAAPGQAGTWILSDPLVKDAKFDGIMEIVVAGKTYSQPLVLSGWTMDATEPALEGKIVAKHGGRVISFVDCPAHVEVVQDAKAGTLTLYSLEDTVLTEAPVIQLSTAKDGGKLTVTQVNGEAGVWRASSPVLKTEKIDGSLKIQLKGSPCEAPLLGAVVTKDGSLHGGTLVTVAGGPRFEVVSDAKARTYTFYAVDETIEGKAYTIENPRVIVTTASGPRTFTLTKVEGEPRAYRLVGFTPDTDAAGEARLTFNLNGKALNSDIRLAPFSVSVK